MKKNRLTSIIICLAMLICIIPTVKETASAYTYNRTLKPGVPQTLTLSPGDHTIDIKLSDGKSGSTLYSKPGWVSVTNTNASVYRVTVPANRDNKELKGSVVIKKNNKIYELKLTQEKNYIKNVPSTKTVPYTAGSFQFTVSVGAGSPIASSDKAWLTISKSGNIFTASYRANTGAAREAKITVQCGNIKVVCNVSQNANPRIPITDLQTTTSGSIYKDEWTSYRGNQLANFYNALINGANAQRDDKASSILTNAKDVTVYSWTCLKDRDAYGNNSDFPKFEANHTYYGTPYMQNADGNTGYYIGFDYTLGGFRNVIQDTSSYFYTRSGNYGPGYGTDCSGFVSRCIGISRTTTDKLKSSSLFTQVTKSGDFATTIKSGDVLYRDGHVLLVAFVIKEGSKAKGIVLLESRNRTTASGRNMYLYYDNDATLSKLFGGLSVSSCHTYIKNVVWGGTEWEKTTSKTLIHIGTVDDFVSSFGGHMLLSRK